MSVKQALWRGQFKQINVSKVGKKDELDVGGSEPSHLVHRVLLKVLIRVKSAQ